MHLGGGCFGTTISYDQTPFLPSTITMVVLIRQEQTLKMSEFQFQSFKEGVPSTKVVFQGALHLKIQ